MSPVLPRLDVGQVRSQFPALSRANAEGIVPAYFDGPGGTQVPQRVLDAIRDYLVGSNSNIEGEYEASIRTDELIAQARVAGGAFVHGDPGGVAFGQNATTLNFLLTRAVGRLLEPGDEIITTTLDHDANVAPWLLLARDRGLTVRQVGVTADLELDLDDLAAQLSDRTRVVAYTLASNAVGTLTPAARIAELAHRAGALAWVNAVHYAPHRRIDVAELGCDVLLCSPYKFFGPHLGLAWLRPSLAADWPAERVRPAGNHPPGHRFETGTLSHEALAGFVAAVGYLESLGGDDADRLGSAYPAIAATSWSWPRRSWPGCTRCRAGGCSASRTPTRLAGCRRSACSAIARHQTSWPANSAAAAATPGTATSTRSTWSARSAWMRNRACSGSASPTTTPRTRSTACSTTWPRCDR